MTCPVCGRSLRAVAHGVICALPCPYARISMPEFGLGHVFAADGRPWGALYDRHGHHIVSGWRQNLRTPVLVER